MGSEKTKIKILVTGGGGFIGIALVRRLVMTGFKVASFSRKIYDEHKKLGVKVFQGDISNLTYILDACEGIDVVFHVAAKVGIWGPAEEFKKINEKGTQNLIDACRVNRVKKLIFTSSASVVFDGKNLEGVNESIQYPENPISNYTSSKAIAEQLVLNANSESLKTISLRPHMVWGPGDNQLIPKILQRAKSGKLRRICKKDFYIDTTYIDNFIDAQLLALEKLNTNPRLGGKAFFISNGNPVAVWDFLNSILVSAGLSPIVRIIPKWFALSIAFVLEMFHKIFRFNKEPFITRFVIEELCSNHWFDISAAKKNLGYSPRISFDEGMKRLNESDHFSSF